MASKQPARKNHLVKVSELFAEYISNAAEEARQAGAIGYMARAMVLATLPHRRTTETAFVRTNGIFRLVIMADPETGLPFGSIPRVLLSFLTTEVVRTQNLEVPLGNNLTEFLQKLGMVPTGGRWGTITRVRTQTERLFSCSITCRYDNDGYTGIKNIAPVAEAHLWWNPKRPNQGTLWKSTVRLTEEFGREIMNHPVPYHLAALRMLTSSPMAIDVYLWTSYRNSYIKQPSHIPWEALQMQFGAGYPFTPQGLRDFKKQFLVALRKVGVVYPEAKKLRPTESHLLFVPGQPHIPNLALPS
jgi:hypothetical protein